MGRVCLFSTVISAVSCHSINVERPSADPLEMDDGKELIEMVCTSYESPDDAPEDDQHDFSMLKLQCSWSCKPFFCIHMCS